MNKGKSENVIRYHTCAHREACDKIAKLARFMVWFSYDTPEDESVSHAYRCDCCDEFEESDEN